VQVAVAFQLSVEGVETVIGPSEEWIVNVIAPVGSRISSNTLPASAVAALSTTWNVTSVSCGSSETSLFRML
jgi:hypothetical protein